MAMWTITDETGRLLAVFSSEEEAWACFCSDEFLNLAAEYEVDGEECYALEIRICRDGEEVLIQ